MQMHSTAPDAAAIRHIAPAQYVSGNGAIAEIGHLVRSHGKRLLLVHGARGYRRHEEAISGSVEDHDVESVRVLHEGPCTETSIVQVSRVGRASRAQVVAAVGGGKVIDAGKGAAHALEVPFVAVPTSPATCAAITALVVLYDEEGRWLRGMPLPRCPDAVLLDLDVLAGAPNRLLAAGVADALAKCHEVRLAHRRTTSAQVTSTSALALCQHLEDLLQARAEGALNSTPPGPNEADRRTVVEVAILLPGVIAGLAGEDNKVAAAHAIHNALTQLPGSRNSLHGELVGFGLLVQLILDEQDPAHLVGFFRRLSLPLGLHALGIHDYDANRKRVIDAVLRAPGFTRAFPDTHSRTLGAAIYEANSVAVSAS